VNSLWITVGGCDTDAMSSTDRQVYERLGALEQLVRHLYERTGVPMPDLAALARSEISDHVRQLIASGNKIAAIKAYRDETNVDLATATKLIESLSG
jgi:ribosomal protein L7/L12